jgi:hypothetical protein
MGSRKVTVPETRCGKNRDRLGQILQHGPLAGDDQGFRRHAGLQLNILELVPSGLAPAPERRHRSALASGVLIRRRRAYRGGRRLSGHGSPVDGPRARAPCAGWPVGRSRALRRGPGRRSCGGSRDQEAWRRCYTRRYRRSSLWLLDDRMDGRLLDIGKHPDHDLAATLDRTWSVSPAVSDHGSLSWNYTMPGRAGG